MASDVRPGGDASVTAAGGPSRSSAVAMAERQLPLPATTSLPKDASRPSTSSSTSASLRRPSMSASISAPALPSFSPPPPPTLQSPDSILTYRHSVQSHISSLLQSLRGAGGSKSMHTDLSLLAERNREHGRAWVQEGYARYMSGVPAEFRLDDGGRGAEGLAEKMMQARGVKRRRRLTDDGPGPQRMRSGESSDIGRSLLMTSQPAIIEQDDDDREQPASVEDAPGQTTTGTPRSHRSFSTSAVKDRRKIFREIAEAARRAEEEQDRERAAADLPSGNNLFGGFVLQQPPPPKNLPSLARKVELPPPPPALTGSGASGAITSDSITSLTSASLSCHTTGMTPMTPWQHAPAQVMTAITSVVSAPLAPPASLSDAAVTAAAAADAAMWADFVDLDAAGTPTTGKGGVGGVPTHRLFPP